MNPARIALVGNPNVGKSTVFNALTGSHQHVGNWPGKTVEKKEGVLKLGEGAFTVIDLPGTYSLSAYSMEEQISRDYIVKEKPALVVDVVDAANLERNLYLTVQIVETGMPLIVALNMEDVAVSRGFEIDVHRLSTLLGGAPIVAMSAARSEGLDLLRRTMLETLRNGADHSSAGEARGALVTYPPDMEAAIHQVRSAIERAPVHFPYDPRWLAIQLLEQDEPLLAEVRVSAAAPGVLPALGAASAQLRRHNGDDVDMLVAEHRYAYVHGMVNQVLTRTSDERVTTSDKIDSIATNRVLGVPIFLALMWVVFKVTTDVAAPLQSWVAWVFEGPVSGWAMAIMAALGLSATWMESLLVDGVIAGVGGVLPFLPVLMSLYLVLGLLEESGYMARVAFVMDELMQVLGLHGKSFVPMVIGFGCTVPALYATRTLETEKDRVLTGLLVPFMSCGARLPVYVLLAGVFFPNRPGTIIFSLYILGILIAIGIGLLLQRVLFRQDEETAFVMELPPYRLPSAQGIWCHMRIRIGGFLRQATTWVLGASCIIWLLLAIPVGGGRFADTQTGSNAFALVARGVAPALVPLGFGSWEAGGALMGGFVAKEVVVSTMAQMFTGEEATTTPTPSAGSNLLQDLGAIVSNLFSALLKTAKAVPSIFGITIPGHEDGADLATPALAEGISRSFSTTSGGHPALAALAFMVFVLLYTPCVASLAAERHELGTRWMWVSIVGQLAVAWLAALVVFQGGLMLGLG